MLRPLSRFASIAAAAAMAGSVTGAVPAFAHHSFALFDMEKSLTLEGTVKQFDWTNPHSWIRLVVVTENNQPEEWMIELPAAASLAREGWNKNYLKVGERISVRVNPLKNGTKGGSLQSFRPEDDGTP
jgi:Family of unknown function (DUF6152)